jgi:glycosyltransferase involved in cell wall biosynthesis
VRSDFVPLGFDFERWKNFKPIELDDFKSIINIVFVGDLSKSMKINHLIYSLAGNPRYSLTFVGGGENIQSTKKIVKDMGADNIYFKGYLEKRFLVDEMHNYHISVVPMHVKYSMPNKLFDAIGSYRPILVFGKNDAADFVEKNNIGWVLDFDLEQSKSFFHHLTIDDIIDRSRNILLIRDNYSKDSIYSKAIRIIMA